MVRKFNELGLDRFLRIQYTGSNLRVNGDNFPDIHDKLCEACEILDLPKKPDLYIQADGSINAFTAGVERPLIVLNSGCIDLLSADELFFVLAHELGHIKSGHVLYHQMALFLPVIGEMVGSATLGIAGLFSTGIQLALLNWQRMSEFTADRAGLLACQDTDSAIRAMIKLAGLPHKFYESINTEDFIAQARDFSAFDTSRLDWLAKALSIMGQSHPWTVMRANEFLKWIESGGYDEVLKMPIGMLAELPNFCSNCGRLLKGVELFCPGCGLQFSHNRPGTC
jgi:Zn-dependent protease with chaperone function